MPIFQPVPQWHFPGWPRYNSSMVFHIARTAPSPYLNPTRPTPPPRANSCDWFSADALYTILPNTTDLGALTFPEGRTYVAIGVNQPRLRKAVYR